ncbi:MAG: hypothetical protein JNK15_09180 [Planctomycetes bacterium]|nr:hypothetical protein [Planctomycetota bacterium]
MSSEQRRRLGFFAAIVDDPWRKLAAVALAIGLWFFIDSRIMQTVRRPVPLRAVAAQASGGIAVDRLAVALPLDSVVAQGFFDGDREIDQVIVVLTGPRYRIAAVAKERLDLVVTQFANLAVETSTSVDIGAGQIRRDLLRLDDIEIRLEPERIRLDVTRIGQVPVPLSLDVVDLVEGPFANRLRRDTAEFVPKEAVVLGSATAIDRWTKTPGKRFRASLASTAGGGRDRQVTAQLEIIDGKDLRLQTPTLLSMQVLPETTTFDLELRIQVDDLALPEDQVGKWRAEAKVRTVRIAAGGNLRAKLINFRDGTDRGALQDWASANLRLGVYVPRPEPGTPLPLELDRQAVLVLAPRLLETIDPNECLLGETVVVKLVRQP